jgi:hypothetical protein
VVKWIIDDTAPWLTNRTWLRPSRSTSTISDGRPVTPLYAIHSRPGPAVEKVMSVNSQGPL